MISSTCRSLLCVLPGLVVLHLLLYLSIDSRREVVDEVESMEDIRSVDTWPHGIR